MNQKTLSGRDLGANNLQRFKSWIEERDAANDWQDYIRQGKLNRSEIANECGFALSVIRQNPAVKTALEALEDRLRATGTFGEAKAIPNASNEVAMDTTSQSVDKRIMAAKAKAEQRVKALEEQNAVLRAEVRDLREQLTRYKHLDDHLCRTGRLLHS
ncbi:MAG: VPA1267 family protein [Sterolibacterium sp.]